MMLDSHKSKTFDGLLRFVISFEWDTVIADYFRTILAGKYIYKI